jgi:hypothetical protein
MNIFEPHRFSTNVLVLDTPSIANDLLLRPYGCGLCLLNEIVCDICLVGRQAESICSRHVGLTFLFSALVDIQLLCDLFKIDLPKQFIEFALTCGVSYYSFDGCPSILA